MVKVGDGAADAGLVKRFLHRAVYKLIGHLISNGFPIVDLTFAEKNGGCHGMNHRVTPRKRKKEKVLVRDHQDTSLFLFYHRS
jgi:hypothetical protein